MRVAQVTQNVFGERVLIVDCGEFGALVGDLQVSFDDNGNVISYSGNCMELEYLLVSRSSSESRCCSYHIPFDAATWATTLSKWTIVQAQNVRSALACCSRSLNSPSRSCCCSRLWSGAS